MRGDKACFSTSLRLWGPAHALIFAHATAIGSPERPAVDTLLPQRMQWYGEVSARIRALCRIPFALAGATGGLNPPADIFDYRVWPLFMVRFRAC